MSNTVFKSYENATRRYYGADTDPFKLVPVVRDPEVAHEIANHVESRLGSISEDELTRSAFRAQSVNRMVRGDTDIKRLKDSALQYVLNMVVVNAELTHARYSPQDFHEDAMQSGAYQMGNGIVTAPLPSPDDLRQ